MGGGVLFVVCVPTAKHEQVLKYGHPKDTGNVKLEVELRSKNVSPGKGKTGTVKKPPPPPVPTRSNRKSSEEKIEAPMEKILEELLSKLEIEHVVWCGDKNGNYYEVFFPTAAGDPCENALHCLTELGIGIKLNSVVSVLPCTVTYSGLDNSDTEIDDLKSAEKKKTWDNFVDSVRSKLTVKQVVDGVRGGGDLTFDYVMLVITADCLAALGLVENNASNIVAAMLVSPLMGPVMSLTFGTIIADKELQYVGFKSLFVGMFLSALFGLIFGLILGTTDMPWGFGDFPTEEMKGRGNVRSLWMGVLWALPSGTGVALALLQGSAGPLIGVAISASLLPPVVNGGLFWALACIYLLYPEVKIPHIKGEAYVGNTTYVPIYSNYIPIEFFINGIVSCCLTLVNVICIFITAIIVLKIKEVAAPYTSTPDLRRFWEHDIRMVRETNRSTLQAAEEDERNIYMENMNKKTKEDVNDALEAAVQEAMNDGTFRKVQRVSYSLHAPEEVHRQLGLNDSSDQKSNRNSALTDLAALDKLITSLLSSSNQSSPMLSRLHSARSSLRGSRRGASNSQLPTIIENRKKLTKPEERPSSIKGLLHNISNIPQRFSTEGQTSEEASSLTKNDV